MSGNEPPVQVSCDLWRAFAMQPPCAPGDAGDWELVDEGVLGEFAIADLSKAPIGSLVRVYRRRAGGGR